MARKVPGYAHGKERKYLPEAFENRDDEEPIAVWIKTPTERQKREVMQMAAASIETDDQGDAVTDSDGIPQMKIDLAYSMRWQNSVIVKFVSRVENYNGSDGNPIATGQELLDHGETEIVSELSAEILTGLSLDESEKKSLPDLSDITANQTRAPDGIATNAEPGDLQKRAGAA